MLVGVGVMIASMPLTAAIARYQTKLQRQQMKNKDARTSIMSEILNNIRSIKLYVLGSTPPPCPPRCDCAGERLGALEPIRSCLLLLVLRRYAWEDSFAQRLFDVRNNKELRMLKKMGASRALCLSASSALSSSKCSGVLTLPPPRPLSLPPAGYLSASSNFLWSFTPFAVAFTTFALFSTISGKPLTSEIVFPAITLFQLLGFPLAVRPSRLLSHERLSSGLRDS
mgnify:CR=1 FL=1